MCYQSVVCMCYISVVFMCNLSVGIMCYQSVVIMCYHSVVIMCYQSVAFMFNQSVAIMCYQYWSHHFDTRCRISPIVVFMLLNLCPWSVVEQFFPEYAVIVSNSGIAHEHKVRSSNSSLCHTLSSFPMSRHKLSNAVLNVLKWLFQERARIKTKATGNFPWPMMRSASWLLRSYSY